MTAPPSADADRRTDWLGTVHDRVHARPRIACLVPSLTETLFALGVGDALVARTGFCIHPRAHARSVQKIGGTKDPDLARLRDLAPTHLVVNVDENRREDVEAAREFVPHIVVTHPQGPEDNVRLVTLLGAIFAAEAAAGECVRRLSAALDELDAAVATLPTEHVLYLIWRKPWMSVARTTYVSATLARAGWLTLPQASGQRYPVIDAADAAWREAERILLSTEPFAFRERDAIAMRETTARPVMLIDGEWTSWYGVRAITGLRALAGLRRSLASR